MIEQWKLVWVSQLMVAYSRRQVTLRRGCAVRGVSEFK